MIGVWLLFGLAAGSQQSPPLHLAEVINLPGRTTRFDYQSFDEKSRRLFLSHMGDGHLVVIDVDKKAVVADLPGYGTVTGVLAVPNEEKVYASATETHEVVVTDMNTLKVITRLKGVRFPDGIAYVPGVRRVFVSDESGGIDLVIDAVTNKVLSRIDLGGEAGNTQYDAKNNRILVAVQSRNEMAAIDPKTLTVKKYPISGGDQPHGFYVDAARNLAYVSCEGSDSLLVVDLATMKTLQKFPVTSGPDVLAFDKGLKRLYVGCEGGAVDVFEVVGRGLKSLGSYNAANAHTLSVDQKTHHVFVALKDDGGKPRLRVLEPVLK
ncbi:MAG: hypothetical protein GC165_04465 [Armatimonadetes bacterium]|nr:hypothetical protein [Armatimonadota bacterium]